MNQFRVGIRLTEPKISKRASDNPVPMTPLADHPNERVDYNRAGSPRSPLKTLKGGWPFFKDESGDLPPQSQQDH